MKKKDIFAITIELILNEIRNRPNVISVTPLYLTFSTRMVSQFMKIPKIVQNSSEKHGEENNLASIAIQYQFEDLHIYEDYFSIKLYFGQVLEKLCIPYSAIYSFELYNYGTFTRADENFDIANFQSFDITSYDMLNKNVEEDEEGIKKDNCKIIYFDDLHDDLQQ